MLESNVVIMRQRMVEAFRRLDEQQQETLIRLANEIVRLATPTEQAEILRVSRKVLK